MNRWSLPLLIGCGVIGIHLLLAVGVLCAVGPEEGDRLEAGGMLQGNVMCLLAEPWLYDNWRWPFHVGSLRDGRAAMYTMPLLCAVFYLLRIRSRCSLNVTILAFLLVALIPYAAGRIVLQGGVEPREAGPWIAVMLLGPLYVIGSVFVMCTEDWLRRSGKNGVKHMPMHVGESAVDAVLAKR